MALQIPLHRDNRAPAVLVPRCRPSRVGLPLRQRRFQDHARDREPMRNRLNFVRLPFRLSYANVVATLALFVALGGTGYAAYSLPRNSVGARELRRGSVGRSELKNGAVESSSVRDGTLAVRDFSASARSALAGGVGSP